MSKKVRTLLRVSSRQQLHDDDIPIQRAEAGQFIAKHSDWEFDKEYLEKGVSAYHNGVEDREVLQEIMQDAKNGEFDILLAYMSDRIGRQEEYSFYVAELNRLGIEVWTIKDGQLKTEEHIDKLLNYIRFWQNEGESRKTGVRVFDTQMEMVKDGKFVGGKAPFGYKLILSGEISNHGRALHKLVIVPEQADIVRQIYSYAVNQGMGFQKIAKTMNENSIPAPILEQWKSGTIRSILTNPIYMGYVAYGRRKDGRASCTRLDRSEWTYAREQNPDLVIVSQDIWERAQEIREARKKQINASKQASSDLYLKQHNVPFSTRGKLALTGLVYCGYCGKKLKNTGYANHWTSKKTGEEKVSYVGRYGCPNGCKPRGSYSQEYLESIVCATVETYLENLKKIDISKETKEMQAQQGKTIEREIKELDKESKKLVSDIATLEEKIPDAIRGDFAFSVDKLSAIIKEKESRKKEIENTKKELKEQLEQASVNKEEMEKFIDIMPKWSELFQEADVQTKQMLLSTLIDKIIVKDEEINIRFKIRLEDYIDISAEDSMENSVHESSGSGVSRKRQKFHHHEFDRIRPCVYLRAQYLPEHFTGRG
jgi:DNA invertase Pin-like site-specific DNA recombinase